MNEHTFSTKIISGHRITIRDDVFEDLELKEGDRVRITVDVIKKHMSEHAVVTDSKKECDLSEN